MISFICSVCVYRTIVKLNYLLYLFATFFELHGYQRGNVTSIFSQDALRSIAIIYLQGKLRNERKTI